MGIGGQREGARHFKCVNDIGVSVPWEDHHRDPDDDDLQVQLLERQLGGSEGDEGRLAALRTLSTTQVGKYF